jgi:hypothetical protein
MVKQKNLEKVVCELNSETKLPKHAMQVPKKDRISDVPNFYCCDSRKDECNYCLTYENRSYCNYRS